MTNSNETNEKSLGVLCPMTVLVADDSPTHQEMIRNHLEELGYTNATYVENGKEAVTEAAFTDFDLILMDILMPEMDGIAAKDEILRHAQESSENKPAPYIVAVTSSETFHERSSGAKASFDDHLPKPYRDKELARILLEAFKQRKRTGNSAKVAAK